MSEHGSRPNPPLHACFNSYQDKHAHTATVLKIKILEENDIRLVQSKSLDGIGGAIPIHAEGLRNFILGGLGADDGLD